MEEIRLLITSVGGLVTPSLIQQIRRSAAESLFIVGVDMHSLAVGFPFCDRNYVVPPGSDPNYIQQLYEIACENRVQVIIPRSDDEVLTLSAAYDRFRAVGITILCSPNLVVAMAIDKGSMLEFLRERHVPIPSFHVPRNINELWGHVHALGYPDKPVVVKPRKAHGGRGFFILRRNFDLLGQREYTEMRLEHFTELLDYYSEFPDLVVMEYLPGEDFSVDVLADRGQVSYMVVRQRIHVLAGTSQVGQVLPNHFVSASIEKIISVFGFDGLVNVQLRCTKAGEPLVYEINPRVSGTIIASAAAGMDLLYCAIKNALGEEHPMPQVPRSVRMYRYFQEMFTDKE